MLSQFLLVGLKGLALVAFKLFHLLLELGHIFLIVLKSITDCRIKSPLQNLLVYSIIVVLDLHYELVLVVQQELDNSFQTLV